MHVIGRFAALSLPLTLGLMAGCAAREEPATPEANAALHYRRAFELLDTAGEDGRRLFEDAEFIIGLDKPYDPQAWSSSLEACSPALEEMDIASRIELCQFGPDDLPSESRPWLGQARRLARVNGVWTWDRFQAGRSDEAMEGLRRGFALARHLGTETNLVSSLVSIAVASITMDGLRRALAEDRLGPASLEAADALLRGLPYGVVSFEPGMRGEKAAFTKLGNEWMKSEDPLVAFDAYLQSQRPSPRLERPNSLDGLSPRRRQLLMWGLPEDREDDVAGTREIFRQDLEFFLGRFDELARLAGEPYDRVRDSLRKLRRVEEVAADHPPEHILCCLLQPALSSAIQSRMKTESRLRGLRGMIKLRLFMLKHGRVPARDDVELPADTCSGQPMTLERANDELIFRSDVEDSDPEAASRAPFYFGVYKLPIPADLRGR